MSSPHAMPSPEQQRALVLQSRVGHAAFTVLGPGAVVYMRILRRNRIAGAAEARAVYRRALAAGRPTLVCANHLTMFDSIFLHHALATVKDYLADFSRFSWNVPAIENFKKNTFLRALTYLGKTVPIDRRGDARHHKHVLDTIKHLASNGEVVTIFPEGGRSRSGRVEPEKATAGIGHILKDLERPQVVCVYMRGERQRTWSYLPAKGDTLHVSAEIIEPSTTERGIKATRDLARQVMEKLKEMEEAHFARLGRAPAREASQPEVA